MAKLTYNKKDGQYRLNAPILSLPMDWDKHDLYDEFLFVMEDIGGLKLDCSFVDDDHGYVIFKTSEAKKKFIRAINKKFPKKFKFESLKNIYIGKKCNDVSRLKRFFASDKPKKRSISKIFTLSNYDCGSHVVNGIPCDVCHASFEESMGPINLMVRHFAGLPTGKKIKVTMTVV